MKIIISKNKIVESLRLCNAISENSYSSPTLQGTLIEVTNNSIKFTSSNGLISAHSIIEKTDDINIIEKGEVLVRTKPFFAIISKLKNEIITLEKVDNSVIKIKTPSFDSNINIMDREQYPYPNIDFSYNNWKELSILPVVFKKAITKIKHTINNNKEKINIMSGVFFNSNSAEKTLEIIGTDSYKLAYYKFDSNLEDFKMVLDTSLIELLVEMIDFDSDVKVYLNDNNIIFKVNGKIIASKIIEGEYPNVSRIIALPKTNKIKISKKSFFEALDRGIAISSTEKKSIVQLNFESEKVEVSFKSAELGNSKENVVCKGNVKEPISIWVNTHFLISLLKIFENDEIALEFSDSLKPITLKDEKEPNFLQILVPIRN